MNASPFKLLASYSEVDQNIFYGRDNEIYALYNLIQQSQLVLIYGGSGTGKTSLINAGLPKAFKITDWYKIMISRKDNINDSLCNTIGMHLRRKLKENDLPLAVRQVFENNWIPVYLFFDQFEEVFTLGSNQECVTFFRTLYAILQENTAVKIIISMREEYLGHLYEYESILPTLFDRRFRVEVMQDNTVCKVINRTCRFHQIELENGDDTTRLILNRVKTGKHGVHLPYLQIYLHSLFLKAPMHSNKHFFEDKIINGEDFSLGKVLNGFIGGKIEEAQSFIEKKYPQIPKSFTEAIIDDFSTEVGTKKAQRVSELADKHHQDEQLIAETLKFFDEDAKLLRADEDDVTRYEPVHDVVALQIHERRSTEDKDFKKFVQDLEVDYERWLTDKILLPETILNKVEVYKNKLEAVDVYKNKLEKLVSASLDNYKRLKRLKSFWVTAFAILAIMAFVALIYVYIQNVMLGEKQKEITEQRDSISKIYSEYVKAGQQKVDEETKRIMKEVEDIEKRAESLRHNRDIANRLIDDAKTILKPYEKDTIYDKLSMKLEMLKKVKY